jgi:hypothetical protein
VGGSIEQLRKDLSTLTTVGTPVAGLLVGGIGVFDSEVKAVTNVTGAYVKFAETLGSFVAHNLIPFNAETKKHQSFLGSLANTVKNTVFQYGAWIPIIGAAGIGMAAFTFAVEKFNAATADSTKSVQTNSQAVTNQVLKIVADAAKLGGLQGLAQATQQIQALALELQQFGGPQGRAFATVLAGIADQIQKFGSLPKDLNLRLNIQLDRAYLQTQTTGVAVTAHDAIRDFVQEYLNNNPITVTPKINLATTDLKIAQAQAAVAGAEAAGKGPQQVIADNRALIAAAEEKVRGDLQQIAIGKKAGDTATQLTGLYQQLTTDQNMVKSARDAITQDQNAIATKQRSDAAKAASAARKAAEAERKIQQERAQDDRETIAAIQRNVTSRRSDIEALAANGQLTAAVKAQEALIRYYTAEIEFVKKHLILQKNKTAEEAKLESEQDRAEAQLDRLRKQRNKAILDNKVKTEDLLVQIAQAEHNRALEEKRLKAEIDLLNTEIAGAKGRTKLELELDRARAQEQLRTLGTATPTQKQQLLGDEFRFLQTEQGFTSTLLGNLIPGGIPSGLTSSAVPTAAQIASGKKQLSDLHEAIVGKDKGITAGQGNVQIDLLRKILNSLTGYRARSQHPEATRQRHSTNASLDYHILGTIGM